VDHDPHLPIKGGLTVPTEQSPARFLHTMTPADILRSWRKHVPDVTDGEASALLPLVENRRGGLLRSMLDAYRAGLRAKPQTDVIEQIRLYVLDHSDDASPDTAACMSDLRTILGMPA